MEIAAASTMKAVNFLATSGIPKITNPTTISPSWPCAKPKMLTLYAQNLNTKNAPVSLTHCSTKQPNSTDTNDETNQNSSCEQIQSSKPQNPSMPISDEPLSSSLSVSLTGLVIDLGPVDTWDSGEVGSPVIKRFLSDDEERWYMWYYGRRKQNPSSDSIGLAVSKNGIHWERGRGPAQSSADVGLVMNCSKDWWAFDTNDIRPSEVVIMSSAKVRASSSVYWLYYTGYNAEKVDFLDDPTEFNLENPERFHSVTVSSIEKGGIGKVLKSLPGLAISQDGRHWARIEGEHHTGALFDVGSERDWDSLFIASPRVVFHGNGDLRMYYHSFDVEKGEFGIGIARSRDGIKWVKLGKIMGSGGGRNGCFDEFGVKNPCVLRNKKDGTYIMAYEGVGADGASSIGLAASPDGLKEWRRLQDEAVLKASDGDGWDNKEVGSPCLVEMDGADVDQWRLYYKGVGDGGITGIGMAVSQGNDIKRFRRWQRFSILSEMCH